MTLARDEFAQIFSRPPAVHGAGRGWQVQSLRCRQLGSSNWVSSTRPMAGEPGLSCLFAKRGLRSTLPQMPTTLPHSG